MENKGYHFNLLRKSNNENIFTESMYNANGRQSASR